MTAFNVFSYLWNGFVAKGYSLWKACSTVPTTGQFMQLCFRHNSWNRQWEARQVVVEAVQLQEAHRQVARLPQAGPRGQLNTVCVVGGGFPFLLKSLG